MERIGLPLPWGIVPTQRLIQPVIGTDPPAGAEIVVTVPGGVVWSVWSIVFTFVASAVVATRRAILTFDDGTTVFSRVRSPAAATANDTLNLSWFTEAEVTGGAGVGDVATMSIPDFPLLGGYRIRTVTSGLDAGDNYGAPVLYVAEYQVRGLERAVERYERQVAEAVAAPG